MNKIVNFLRNANWWEVAGWFFIFYFSASKYGETESLLNALWTGFCVWAFFMIGYNWRDNEK